MGSNNFLRLDIWSDGYMCYLNLLMLRGRNCDDWARKLNSLMCIEMGITEGVFNSNTDDKMPLVKL